MHPAIAAASLTLASALGLAAYVATRAERDSRNRGILAVLGVLVVWTVGTLCRFSSTSETGLWASLHLVFFGIFFSSPLWLVSSLQNARHPIAERPEFRAALLVPSALAFTAFLTNDAHQLVMREVSFAALARGGTAWAGPLFWLYLCWAYGLVAWGSIALLRAARGLLVGRDRRRGWLLGTAALVPTLGSSVYLFQWLPVSFDLTPAALGISMLLTTIAIFRYDLLEAHPLAHRDVIEHLDEGVLLAAADGQILQLNLAATQLLDRGRSQLFGLPLARALAALAPVSDAALAARLEALAGAGELERLEVRTARGRRIEVRVAALRGGGSSIAGHLAILRDRTEERRDELEGRHAQMLESLGTLAAGIAHEVNNPLAYIRANLSQIQRMGEEVEAAAAVGGPDAKLAAELADLREIAEETFDGIERIGRIVADIRTLGGVSRQDVFGELSLNRVAGDALRLSNLLRDPAIAIETRFADALPIVEGSAPRLVQAVLNLLLNARQALAATPAPRIEIETRVEAAFVELRIRDNGPGISPELQERIFDPFFSTKGPGRGTGLGLSISLDIARDHGGSLRVDSAPGQGARFDLRLPRRPGDVGGPSIGR